MIRAYYRGSPAMICPPNTTVRPVLVAGYTEESGTAIVVDWESLRFPPEVQQPKEQQQQPARGAEAASGLTGVEELYHRVSTLYCNYVATHNRGSRHALAVQAQDLMVQEKHRVWTLVHDACEETGTAEIDMEDLAQAVQSIPVHALLLVTLVLQEMIWSRSGNMQWRVYRRKDGYVLQTLDTPASPPDLFQLVEAAQARGLLPAGATPNDLRIKVLYTDGRR